MVKKKMVRILNGYFIEGIFKEAIYCADNLEIMKQMDDNSIDLICFDPPFNSNKKYNNYKENEKKEIIKTKNTSFNDEWSAGLKGYRNKMLRIIQESKRILKETGIIIIHCDKYANFYIRQCLNDVFNDHHLINEIIWCYHGGGAPKHQLKQKHDTIYVYRKGKEYTFNPLLIPRDRIKYYKKGVKVKSEGKYLNDWWCDIPSRGTATQSSEWIGYPTQKPLELYKRLINLFSNKNDIIIDPFCGSGTTLVAAKELERYWIGIDKNHESCRIASLRLKYPLSNVIGYRLSYKEVMEMDWYDLQCYICYKLNGRPNPKKTGDKGFDGWIPIPDPFKYPNARANIPIQVKKGVANSDWIAGFVDKIEKKHRKWGIFVADGFSKSIREDVAQIEYRKKIHIVLYRIRDLCSRKKIPPTSYEIKNKNLTMEEKNIETQRSLDKFLKQKEMNV